MALTSEQRTLNSATPSAVVESEFWKSGLKSTARSKVGLPLFESESGPPTTKVAPGATVPERLTSDVV